MTTELKAALTGWQSKHFEAHGENGYTRNEFVNCLLEGDNYPDYEGAVTVEGFGEVFATASNTNNPDNLGNGQEIWVIFRNGEKYYRLLGVHNVDPSGWYIEPEFGMIWDDLDTIEELVHSRVNLGDFEVDLFVFNDKWKQVV